MLSVASKLHSIGGVTKEIRLSYEYTRDAPRFYPREELWVNSVIDTLVIIFVDSKLGYTREAYTLIIPPLQAHGLLPTELSVDKSKEPHSTSKSRS